MEEINENCYMYRRCNKSYIVIIILYAHVFFARQNTGEQKLERYLPKNMKWRDILE